MKTITLTEPYATLVSLGAKRVETRSWQTRYRGPLAIHAAKGMPRWARDLCTEETFFSALMWNLPTSPSHRGIADRFPRGKVIATCTLADVVPIVLGPEPKETHRCVALDEEGIVRIWSEFKPALGSHVRSGIAYPDCAQHEADFGDYTPGRFAWILTDVEKLPEPIPAKGALGLWAWTP